MLMEPIKNVHEGRFVHGWNKVMRDRSRVPGESAEVVKMVAEACV